MSSDCICVPFRIPNVYAGLAEIRGLLRGSKDTIVLDFEVKESLLDLLRLDSNVVTLPLAEISSIEFRQGWISRWIIITVNRLETLRPVPGSKAGELRLKIARKHTAAAGEVVSRIQMALTTLGLQQLINRTL